MKKFLVVSIITMLIALSTLSCGKVEEGMVANEENVVPDIPNEDGNALYENINNFRMHMQGLDDFDEALGESIDSQNWEDVGKYAMQLKNTSPVIFTGKGKEELPLDFVLLDTKFHLQALAVAQAAKAREMVSLNIEYEKLQQTCDNCHEKYKKK